MMKIMLLIKTGECDEKGERIEKMISAVKK